MHIPATFRPHYSRSKKINSNSSANDSQSLAAERAATSRATTAAAATTLSSSSSSSSPTTTTTTTKTSETDFKNGSLLLSPELANKTSGKDDLHSRHPSSKLASRPVSSISTNGKPPMNPSPLRQINIHSASSPTTTTTTTTTDAEIPPSLSSPSSSSSLGTTPMAVGTQLLSTSSPPRSTKTGETTLNTTTSSSSASSTPPLPSSSSFQMASSSSPPLSPSLPSNESQLMKSKQAARFANLLLNFKLASDLTNKPPDVRHTTSAGTSAFHGRPPAVDMQLFHKPQINERALGPQHNYQSNFERVIVTTPPQGYFDPLSDLPTNDNIAQRIATEHIFLPTLGTSQSKPGSEFQIQPQPGAIGGGFGPSITTTTTTTTTPASTNNFNNNIFLTNTNQIPQDFSSLEDSVSHQPVIYVSPETLLRAQKAKAIFELKYDLIYSFQGSTVWLGQGVDIPRTDKGLPIFTQYNPLQTIRNRRYRPRFTAGANAYNNDSYPFDSAIPSEGNRSGGSSHGSISHLYHKSGSQGRKTNPDFSMATFFWNIDVYELFSDLNWRVVQYSLMRDRFGRHVFPSSEPDVPDNSIYGNGTSRIDYVGDQPKLSQMASAAEDLAFESSLTKLGDDLETRTNSLAVPPPVAPATASHHLIHHHHHYSYHPSTSSSSNHHLPLHKPVLSKIQDKLRQNFSSNSSPALSNTTTTTTTNTTPQNNEGTGLNGSKASEVHNKQERIPTIPIIPVGITNVPASASAGTEVALITASTTAASVALSTATALANPSAAVTTTPTTIPTEATAPPRPSRGTTPIIISDSVSHLRGKNVTPEVSEVAGISPLLSKKLPQQSSSPNLGQHMTAAAAAANIPKNPSKLSNNTLATEEIKRRHSMFPGNSDAIFPEQLKTPKDIHIESVRQRLQEQSALNNTISAPDSSVMPSLTQPLTPVLLVNDKKIESSTPESSLYKKDTSSSNALDSNKIPEIYISEPVNGSDEGSTSTSGSVLLRPLSNSPNNSGMMTSLAKTPTPSSSQIARKKKMTKQEQRQIMEQHKEQILQMYSSELSFLELVFLLRYISITHYMENFNKGQSTKPMGLIYGNIHGKGDDSALGTPSDDLSNVTPPGSSSTSSSTTNGGVNNLSVSSINGASSLSMRKLVPTPIGTSSSTASSTTTVTPAPSLMPSVSKSKFPGPPGAAAVAAATAAGHKPAATAVTAAAASTTGVAGVMPAATMPNISSETAHAMSLGQPLMIPAAVQEREARQLVEDIMDTASTASKDTLPRVRSALSEFESQMSTARRTRISATSTRLDNLLAHSDQTLNRLSTTLAIEVKKVTERMDNLERSLGPGGGLFGWLGILGSPYPRRFLEGSSKPGRSRLRRRNRRSNKASTNGIGTSIGVGDSGGSEGGKSGKKRGSRKSSNSSGKNGSNSSSSSSSSIMNGKTNGNFGVEEEEDYVDEEDDEEDEDEEDEDEEEEDEEDEEEEEELDLAGRSASKAFRVFSGGPRTRIATPSMTTRIGYVMLEYTLVMLMWIIWGFVAIMLRIKKVALFFWYIFRWFFFWC
ncbi:uncharacterized protein SAPINGB_P004949 [Magnusiomyces paraingens]|uniref:Uncharacterized protein n=1 Tax=Magnusiomyces paraingens TaxID=2606893 RepID=A0A5E8C0A6_9ASCO|nr:uncharacterized protein SAPINGB_P004949 [Saprochaete ingens]VVT56305.1 unnamed protein product [Saprochaete ingens]